MKNDSFWFAGPIIVYVMTVASLVTLYLMIDPADITDTSRSFLRVSGRAGMFLFFISFGASALNRIFNAEWSKYLVRNRRYYGISTAIILWSHFLVLLSMSVTAPEWFRISVPWYILYPGTGTFVLVGLMALSSNNSAVKKLGARWWRLLHLIGGYMALSAFIGEYVLILYLQPILLPDYVFHTANSPVVAYTLLAVPLLLLYLRFRKR